MKEPRSADAQEPEAPTRVGGIPEQEPEAPTRVGGIPEQEPEAPTRVTKEDDKQKPAAPVVWIEFKPRWASGLFSGRWGPGTENARVKERRFLHYSSCMSTTYEMVPEEFRAIVAREREDGTIRPAAESWDRAALRPGVVPIRVLCSSLNYKDALSATGHRGVSRNYPHVPGIDAAGVRLDNNEQVIVTGFDLGMGTPGGFAEYVAVPEGWIVKMPAGMTAWDAMALGTAGFTAALGVDAVQAGGVVPGAGPIVVTGASGGVGSLSVQILSKLGFEVHAVSGKSGAKDWLAEIGAAKVIGREEFLAASDRALLREEFAGAVDTLGGEYLRRILASLKFGGVAAACGMIGGAELSGTVFPFILRGVRLVGLASADTPQERKQELWNRLWSEWKIEPRGVRTVGMAELPAEIDRILAGEQMGRVVVDIGRG